MFTLFVLILLAATADLDGLVSLARQRRSLPPPSKRKRIRERAGLSQLEVARVLGVSESAVSRWETGLRTPRDERLGDYLELLDRLIDEVQ